MNDNSVRRSLQCPAKIAQDAQPMVVFRAFHDSYRGPYLRWAQLYLGSRADAEDAVHDALEADEEVADDPGAGRAGRLSLVAGEEPRQGRRPRYRVGAAGRSQHGLRRPGLRRRHRPGPVARQRPSDPSRILEPDGARVLACVLHLAGREDSARFWWQFAAGADDNLAKFCLFLHHVALGEIHEAN